jgi:hypothetical protein
MKFCPVVPEICRGQVHGPQKERKENNDNQRLSRACIVHLIPNIENISTGRHFQNGRHNTAKIQHCPISSKFDMWVDNDVPN